MSSSSLAFFLQAVFLNLVCFRENADFLMSQTFSYMLAFAMRADQELLNVTREVVCRYLHC